MYWLWKLRDLSTDEKKKQGKVKNNMSSLIADFIVINTSVRIYKTYCIYVK